MSNFKEVECDSLDDIDSYFVNMDCVRHMDVCYVGRDQKEYYVSIKFDDGSFMYSKNFYSYSGASNYMADLTK